MGAKNKQNIQFFQAPFHESPFSDNEMSFSSNEKLSYIIFKTPCFKLSTNFSDIFKGRSLPSP